MLGTIAQKIKVVRKSAKRHVFTVPNLRTHGNIRKQTKKTAKLRFYLFWQPQIDNIRTEISLYEAEIMETLDLLEEFLNDLKH